MDGVDVGGARDRADTTSEHKGSNMQIIMIMTTHFGSSIDPIHQNNNISARSIFLLLLEEGGTYACAFRRRLTARRFQIQTRSPIPPHGSQCSPKHNDGTTTTHTTYTH